MRKQQLYIFITLCAALFISVGAYTQNTTDTTNLPFRIEPEGNNPFSPQEGSSNINLKDPSNISTDVEYDAETNEYVITKKAGDTEFATPYSMSFEEFQDYDVETNLNDYWRDRYQSETFENQGSLIPKINVQGEAFETIFGSNTIDIRPQGSATLKFGIKISDIDNPSQPEELRRNTTFDFDEEIRMNVTGKIGDNLEMKVSYDTESQFDFDNTMNLRYQGKEDDIIQKIEAGDVSLPLTTSLISGSQSLFGILSELKFGNLYVTSVFSQQEGETKTINVEGGAQKTDYSIPIVKYDRNRHFFLSHLFRDKYDDALASLPIINSEINITKVEVWVTNTTQSTDDARNILALLDLGEEKEELQMYGAAEQAIYRQDKITVEGSNYPYNDANSLYKDILGIGDSIRSVNYITQLMAQNGFENGEDFEKIEFARKLKSNEYYLNDKLGYISLNSALNSDEVLAVSFQFTAGTETYQVGEFSNEGVEAPSTLMVKLLKAANLNPKIPNWNLMMKNIYSLGAFQLSQENFVLEVEYYDDETGTRLLNIPDSRNQLDTNFTGEKILRVMNLDTLNSKLNPVTGGDGVFDFVEGAVIRTSNGRMMFPQVEPFGGYLKEALEDNVVRGNPADVTNRFVFNELYDSTQYIAEQIAAKNKFYISGNYKSSGGSEIFLNSFNIPQGSVKVTAGGLVLQENVHYTVDYNMGRVKIIDESFIASGTPIKITLESQSMFSMQSKTLMGTHLDYRFTNDLNLGATIMNLTERPLTQKVNMGEEPISNTIWGLNASYRTDAPFLTRAVDFIPLIETKEMSSITMEGEFAQLIPGHNDAIGSEGNAFVDDFEGSESSIDIKSRTGWVLSSAPSKSGLFPETTLFDDLAYGYNRATLAWYQIDQLFFRSGTPVNAEAQNNLLVYRVREQDIFPNKESQNGVPSEITTFDLAFYPKERGPYNYDAEGSEYSAGINEAGELKDPKSRWGGVMRELSVNDFEASNVEYIMFWMMDPFVEQHDDNPGGELYFNLGNISEDILKDSRKSYEHGLPTDNPPNPDHYSVTSWGRVPAIQTASPGFVNDDDLRSRQDIGLDGLAGNIFNDEGVSDEAEFFADYLVTLRNIITNENIRAKFENDPSNDDYMYFKSDEYDGSEADILTRYKRYNNHEGNSLMSSSSSTSTQAQTTPDVEDINNDFTLSENEAYFQYKVHLDSTDMIIGRNYITDIQSANAKLKDGTTKKVNWYQFKVPIADYENKYGNIQDFKSIRFMRMFLNGWEDDIVLRFAKLELVRSEWRKYDYAIQEKTESDGEGESYDPIRIPFNISTVNIEENNSRYPVNYVLPPGVSRQQDPSNPQLTQLNEQSLAMQVDSLNDGYSKAIYKTINMDMRDYKKLQMYIHAESRTESEEISDYEMTCFIRLGSDFTDNYYEYEVPLIVTPEGTYEQYSEEDRFKVWPLQNNMEIDFEELIRTKVARNNARRAANSTITLLTPYKTMSSDGTRRITVKGNPSISNVKTLMIGVRNPLDKNNNFPGDDDGLPKSAEIWVNELRLTDFDEEGGWAATGRMTARLADFGSVTFAGSTTQAGFGSIEQKAQERAKEETNQVDVSANFELGKFLPKESNVRIPMYVGYSRTEINPEFDPLDQDIPMDVIMENDNIPDYEKDEKLNQAQDLTERKSINLTNVGIGRTGSGKPKFYSPSNLSFSAAYSELWHRDVGVDYDIAKNYNGALNYVFNNQPKNVQPFKKNKFLRKPALRLIGDFNFYYAPSQVSLMTNMNRLYSETLLRNLNNPTQQYNPTYNKSFDWNRKSNIKYNFSKGLKFDFATSTNSLVVEPDGLIDKSDQNEWNDYKDTIYQSIMDFGTPQIYSQTFNASYAIPINKIPILNWVSATARYSATYGWGRGRGVQSKSDSLYTGNNIKNSQKITLNSQFNMNKLYNKVGFIKDIDKKYKKSKKVRKKPRFETKEFKDIVRLKANVAKRITHNLKTEEEIKVILTASDGKTIESTFEIINETRITVTVTEDVVGATITVSGKVQVKDSPALIVMESGVLLITGFKQFSGTYSQTRGSNLNGYTKDHAFSSLAENPGLPFVFGHQDPSFAQEKANQNSLISTQSLVQPYVMSDNLNLNLKATYQPVKAFRIDFAAMRNTTGSVSEYYLYNDFNDAFNAENRMQSGSYSINIWMLSSSFGDAPTTEDLTSESFSQYRENINTIAWRLASDRYDAAQQIDPNGEYGDYSSYNPGSERDSMPVGYTSTNPEVAIPAFLAAYTDQDANTIDLAYLSSWAIFRPTWRIKYDGLKNVWNLDKHFRNITITHGYNSTFTVGSFKSNAVYNYDDAENGDIGYMSWTTGTVDTSMYVAEYDVSSFSATEQFMPLFGIDVTWKNNVLTKFEYKKTRSMTMGLTNNKLTEVYSWEWVFGTGYRFDDLKLKLGNKPVVSDLNLRGDLSVRDNLTISRDLAESFDDVTAGQKTFRLNITADYQLSDKLQLRGYIRHNLTDPKISISYRTAETEFGFEVRFSLAP